MTVVADTTRIQEKGLALRDRHSIREADSGAQKREVVIISAGWGSSGYYSEEVLERDIPRIFPVGTHMYLNHPTERDDMERPERGVLDLVGTIVETPRKAGIDMVAVVEVYEHWVPVIEAMADDIGLSIRAYGISEEGEAAGKKGPQIMALTEGLSVDYVTMAGAGGKIGKLIESARDETPEDKKLQERRNAAHWIESKIHRDFTFYADDLFGSGHITRDERKTLSGAIGEALDAFSKVVEKDAPKLLNRDPFADPEGEETEVEENRDPGSRSRKNNEEAEMAEISESDFAELKSTVETLKESVKETEQKVSTAESERDDEKTKRERAEEALVLNRAATVATEAVKEGKYKGLPATAKARAVEAALKDVPKTEDGKLDESKLKENADSCAHDEAKYLVEAGAGAVSDFGASPDEETEDILSESDESEKNDKVVEALAKRFERAGMSKEAALIAAEGR